MPAPISNLAGTGAFDSPAATQAAILRQARLANAPTPASTGILTPPSSPLTLAGQGITAGSPLIQTPSAVVHTGNAPIVPTPSTSIGSTPIAPAPIKGLVGTSLPPMSGGTGLPNFPAAQTPEQMAQTGANGTSTNQNRGVIQPPAPPVPPAPVPPNPLPQGQTPEEMAVMWEGL